MQTSSNLQAKRTGLPEPTNKIDSKSTSGSDKKQAQPDAEKAEAMEKVLDAMSAEKKAAESQLTEAKDQKKVEDVTDETARLSIEDKPTAESAKAVNVDPANVENASNTETKDADASHDAVSELKMTSSAKKRSFDQVCQNVQMADETGAATDAKSAAEPLAAEEKKDMAEQ